MTAQEKDASNEPERQGGGGRSGSASPRPLTVHFSGIAGTGMSSLAGLFCLRGDRVSGSDTAFHPPVGDVLDAMPVRLHKGYHPDHIPADVDLCVVGNIVSRGNPEAEEILDRHLPYASMPEALYRHFIRGRLSIVVAGTHGKTTTTSFIAFLLMLAGRDPGFFIGGRPLDMEAGYRLGGGAEFVSEGDEYETAFFDRSSKFLKYHPDILVLTPCEYDHVDFFADEAAYRRAFANLVNQVPSRGRIISSHDDGMNRQVVSRALTPVTGFGHGSGCEVRIRREKVRSGGGFSFQLDTPEGTVRLDSPLAGTFNAGNLAAGVAVGLHLGIPLPVIREGVSRFRGVARRLTHLNTIGATRFYEDFAHHPTALARMLEGLRKMFPRHRLICLFEPRSHSLRRGDFQERLAESLARADRVVIRRVSAPASPQVSHLDEERLAADLIRAGRSARVAATDEDLRREVLSLDFSRPTVVVAASNGAFGGLPHWLRHLDPAVEKEKTHENRCP